MNTFDKPMPNVAMALYNPNEMKIGGLLLLFLLIWLSIEPDYRAM